MIIDLILDRKDGESYNPETFYRYCFDEPGGALITYAMDYLNEIDVKQALCGYVMINGYSEAICEYINSVEWLPVEFIESDHNKQIINY